MLWGNTYNIESQKGIEFGATTRLTAGINYRHNTLSSNFHDGFHTEDRLGLYGQGEWKPSHMFQVVGGARYDLDTFINPTISPRGSFLFTPVPNHTIRATIALGYRPPTLAETFAVREGGNLRPEKIVSYEMEYQGWYVQHRLRTRAALFYNHISDLITFGTTGVIQAGGVADIYGGEAGIEFLATK